MQARNGRMAQATGRIGLPHLSMVVAGLATFVLVASVLGDRSETVQVWVADTDVAAGSLLDAGDLTTIEVSADEVVVDLLLPAIGSVPSGRVRTGLVAGEPVLASALVPADVVTAGRTFTIPVDRSVVDGLGLLRGDRVDVIGTIPVPRVDAEEPSNVVEQIGYVIVDVEVVRLPAAPSSGAFAAAGSRESWITVSVDHEQALRLSAALDSGDVELVRSTGAAAIEVGS